MLTFKYKAPWCNPRSLPALGGELGPSPFSLTTSSSKFFRENAFPFFPRTRKLTGLTLQGSAKYWIFFFYYDFYVKPVFKSFHCESRVGIGKHVLVNGQRIIILGFTSRRVSRQSVNEWAWLCSNKTLFIKMHPGPQPLLSLEYGEVGTQHWCLGSTPRASDFTALGCGLGPGFFQSSPGNSSVTPRLRTSVLGLPTYFPYPEKYEISSIN